MTLLSKDQILGADDRQYETVDVPEWGGQVRVRGLSGAERDDFEEKSVRYVGNQRRVNARNIRARLLQLCVVDGDGLALFTQADVIKLGTKSASALERVFDTARRLSGMSEDDVKEMEEGFGDGQSANSTSDSPSLSASPSAISSPASPPGNSPSGWPMNGATAPSAGSAATTAQR
jgi:hypothetical protein